MQPPKNFGLGLCLHCTKSPGVMDSWLYVYWDTVIITRMYCICTYFKQNTRFFWLLLRVSCSFAFIRQLMTANEHETRSNNQKNRVFCLRYVWTALPCALSAVPYGEPTWMYCIWTLWHGVPPLWGVPSSAPARCFFLSVVNCGKENVLWVLSCFCPMLGTLGEHHELHSLMCLQVSRVLYHAVGQANVSDSVLVLFLHSWRYVGMRLCHTHVIHHSVLVHCTVTVHIHDYMFHQYLIVPSNVCVG